MDSNNPINILIVMVTLYVFALTLSILSLDEWNMIFTVLSFIGLTVGMIVALLMGLGLQREGVSLAVFFLIYAGIAEVTLVWFVTRFGNHLGFL